MRPVQLMVLRVSIKPAHETTLRDILTRIQMRRAPEIQHGNIVTADKGDCETIIQALDVMRQAMTADKGDCETIIQALDVMRQAMTAEHMTSLPALFTDPRFRALATALLTPGNAERTQQTSHALSVDLENI
jgi:hypothetical protein